MYIIASVLDHVRVSGPSFQSYYYHLEEVVADQTLSLDLSHRQVRCLYYVLLVHRTDLAAVRSQIVGCRLSKEVQTKGNDLTKKSKNLAPLGHKNISSNTDPTSAPVAPISHKNFGVSNFVESGSPRSFEIKGHQASQIRTVQSPTIVVAATNNKPSVSIGLVQPEEGVQDKIQIQSYDGGEVNSSLNEPLRTESLRGKAHEVSRSIPSRNVIVPSSLLTIKDKNIVSAHSNV